MVDHLLLLSPDLGSWLDSFACHGHGVCWRRWQSEEVTCEATWTTIRLSSWLRQASLKPLLFKPNSGITDGVASEVVYLERAAKVRCTFKRPLSLLEDESYRSNKKTEWKRRNQYLLCAWLWLAEVKLWNVKPLVLFQKFHILHEGVHVPHCGRERGGVVLQQPHPARGEGWDHQKQDDHLPRYWGLPGPIQAAQDDLVQGNPHSDLTGLWESIIPITYTWQE